MPRVAFGFLRLVNDQGIHKYIDNLFWVYIVSAKTQERSQESSNPTKELLQNNNSMETPDGQLATVRTS